MVGVAQLVEHLVVVQVVAGSSPVTHPKAKATCVRGNANRVAFVILCDRDLRPAGRMCG